MDEDEYIEEQEKINQEMVRIYYDDDGDSINKYWMLYDELQQSKKNLERSQW